MNTSKEQYPSALDHLFHRGIKGSDSNYRNQVNKYQRMVARLDLPEKLLDKEKNEPRHQRMMPQKIYTAAGGRRVSHCRSCLHGSVQWLAEL